MVVSKNDLHNTCGQVLVEELNDAGVTERSEWGWLDDDGVTSQDCGDDLPHHEEDREVPLESEKWLAHV